MNRILVAIGLVVVMAGSLVAQEVKAKKTIKEVMAIKDSKERETELLQLIPTIENTETQGVLKIGVARALVAQEKYTEALAELNNIVGSKSSNKVKAEASQNKVFIYLNNVKDYPAAIIAAAQVRTYNVPKYTVQSYYSEGVAKSKTGDKSGAISAYTTGLQIKDAPIPAMQGRIAFNKAKLTNEQTDWKAVLSYPVSNLFFIKPIVTNIKNFDDCGLGLAKQLSEIKNKEAIDLLLAKTATSPIASRVVIAEFSKKSEGNVEVISTLLKPAQLSELDLQNRWNILAGIRASLAGQIANNEAARQLAGVVATEMEEVGNILKGANK